MDSKWPWFNQIGHIEWIGFNQIDDYDSTLNQINHCDSIFGQIDDYDLTLNQMNHIHLMI